LADFRKILKYQIHPVRADFFHADGRTDMTADYFHNFTNTPKNGSFYYIGIL